MRNSPRRRINKQRSVTLANRGIKHKGRVGNRFWGVTHSQWMKKSRKKKKENRVYVQDPNLCHALFSPLLTQLDARYMSGNLLNPRGLSMSSGCDDHRVPRLLLHDVTSILHNRQGRNRTSCWLSKDGAWHVTPVHHASPVHLHRRVHRTGTSGITWPFTKPGQFDHGFTPCVYVTALLNGVTRKVGHNNEEDRD